MSVSIQNELNIRDVKTEHTYLVMEVWSKYYINESAQCFKSLTAHVWNEKYTTQILELHIYRKSCYIIQYYRGGLLWKMSVLCII